MNSSASWAKNAKAAFPPVLHVALQGI